MTTEHPARAAAERSRDAVHRKDRAVWLDNFAEDAVVEDPVGPSPFDPDGKGHRGKEAIGAFWDRHIEPNLITYEVKDSYAAGSEVANVGSITVVLPNGARTVVEGVFTYRVNDAGELVALRAFWEMDRLRVLPPGE